MLNDSEKNRKIIAVVGRTGFGKSFFVKSFIYSIKRVVIFDTANEYSHPKFKVFDDYDEFINELKANGNDKIFQAILKFEEVSEYVDAIGAVDLAQNFTLVIEEVHQYGNARSIQPNLEKAIRLGRHRATSLIMISQRFADLNLIIRNNLDALVAFNLSAPNDIKYLSEVPFVGVENAEKIGVLPKFQGVYLLNS